MLLLSALFAVGEASCAEPRKPTDLDVKAAFIFNFAKFVDWPPGKAQESGATMNVCVVGDDPLGAALAAIEGKIAGGKRIKVKQEPPQQSLGSCSILFVGDSEKEQVGRLLETVKNAGVLTVGDTKGFAQQGIMINFYMEDKRVRFEINPKAAGRAGLKISSNLLKIARIVGAP
jgi:hypothetical protein